MFSYKLLTGKSGVYYPDNEDVTAKDACDEIREKFESLQIENTKVAMIVQGKRLDDDAKLKDHKLETLCCVHVISIYDKVRDEEKK